MGAPLVAKVCTLLFAIQPGAAALVSVLFWVLVYPTLDRPLGAPDVAAHGINLLVSVVDVALSGQPLPMSWFVYLLAYGWAYVIFSAIQFVTFTFPAYGCPCKEEISGCLPDGSCVMPYAVLNWTTPVMSVIVVLIISFAVAPLFHGAFALLKRFQMPALRRRFPRALPDPPTSAGSTCARLCTGSNGPSLDLGDDWAKYYAASVLGPSSQAWLAVRVVLAVAWLSIMVWHISVQADPSVLGGAYFGYLTQWSAIVLLVYLLLAPIVTYLAQLRVRKEVVVDSP